MSDGCDNWPSLGFTGVCATCIQDPTKVQKVADEMYESRSRFTEGEQADHYRIAWLSREQRCLEMTLEIMKGGETDVRKAIDKAKDLYWSTKR